MKHYLLAVALICFGSTSARAILGSKPPEEGPRPSKPYFETIVRDIAHPKVTASTLYTSRFDFDGGETKAALVWHKGDPNDTLWPQQLLDLGMPPLSWALLELGVGGNRESAFGRIGSSVDIAPTILSPLSSALKGAGGTAAVVGNLLVSPNGSGVNISFGWKANVIQNGGVARFNEWRFPPRFGFGYTYQF